MPSGKHIPPSPHAHPSSSRTPLWAMIGGGNMGRAIAEAALAAGPGGELDRFLVAERDPEARERLDAPSCETPQEALQWLLRHEDPREPAPLVLAVKPQSLPDLARDLRPFFEDRSRVVISVLAGTPGAKIRAALGPAARVVRAMPNLPASVRLACTAICLSAGAHAGDEDFALDLFKGIGPAVVRIPEDLMDAFTAVVGSGPAYLFYLAESMTAAATRLGFDPETADRVVRATLLGSSTMLAKDPRTPQAMRAAVTSKGGTTAAAAKVLDDAQVMDTIVKALTAARDRGRELAKL